jgi:predicted ester cyclase
MMVAHVGLTGSTVKRLHGRRLSITAIRPWSSWSREIWILGPGVDSADYLVCRVSKLSSIKEQDEMSIEENRALVRSWYDVPSIAEWLRRRPDVKDIEGSDTERLKAAMPAFFAPEYVSHRPGGDMPLEAFVQYQITRLPAFPDLSCTVEDIIAEGQKVMVRFIVRGTHTGRFRDIPATGKKIEMGGISLERCAAGKMVEGWHYSDTLGMMQQLGMIPSQ